MLSQFDYLLNQIVDLRKRVSVLERHKQSKTFIWSDGSHNRVLIGYQKDGFGTDKDWGFKISREGYDVKTATDAQLIISSKFSIPREANIAFGIWRYSDSATYEALSDCQCRVDFDDWPDSSVYLEVTGKTGADTGYFRLYDVTNAGAVAGSEISTTSTSVVVLRSGAITKPSGQAQMRLEFKVTPGNPGVIYLDSYSCRVVMRYAG